MGLFVGQIEKGKQQYSLRYQLPGEKFLLGETSYD